MTTDKANEKQYPLVDDAGRKFAADIAEIVGRYREQLESARDERDAALEEAESIKAGATAKYKRVFDAARAECAASIDQSASKWASKAEHPAHIMQIASEFTRPLVGAFASGSSRDPSRILEQLQWMGETRLYNEKQQERASRRMALMRGRGIG